jgi:glucose/arabinose dehydrogenase
MDFRHRPSRVRAALVFVVLVVLTLILAACGSGTGAAGSTPSPVPSSSTAPAASPGASGSGSIRPATSTGPSTATGPVSLDLAFVAGGLDAPLDVTNAGDGSERLFVVEQAGRIRIVRDGRLVERPFLDIADRVGSGGERGLLGLAFHPAFPTDPRLFVDYTDLDGDTVIAEYTLGDDPDIADPASELVLLRIDQPYPNHNGGSLGFGPDGYLYVGMGDGGSGGDPHDNGQRLDTLLGKILRVDIDVEGDRTALPYEIPGDNPFVGRGDARPEIWHSGLRNPWRFRFDRATGDLWIGDVGQGAWEEIDVARAGGGGLDFGWNRMEGFACFPVGDGCATDGKRLPVGVYDHGSGCSVTGGVVYRGAAQPGLAGLYVFGDYCSGTMWTLDPTGDERREPRLALESGRSLSSFGEGEDGELYTTDIGAGELLRVVVAP